MHRELARVREALDTDGAEIVVLSSVTLERFAFVTAYVMRKLNEAAALTVDVTESSWAVSRFPPIQPTPHRKWFSISEDGGDSWRQPLEQYYDLSRPTETKLRFATICNYLVHHFAFEPRYAPEVDGVEILFNSDRTKDRLFLIRLATYAELVEEVAYDEVGWVDMNRAEGRVVQRRRRPALE